MNTTTQIIGIVLMTTACVAAADQVTVTMSKINAQGMGTTIGTVDIRDSAYGIVVSTNLKGLTPGDHGFHVHQRADCGAKEKDGKTVVGLAAGGHYDPRASGRHEGPIGRGHGGDLPVLMVGPDGTTNSSMTAPHLKVAEIRGRSLMIHEGGDNYSDQPKALGGGGARIACGIVP